MQPATIEKIVGNGNKNLICLSDYLVDQPDPIGAEIRNKSSRVLGIFVAMRDENLVVVSTPDSDKLMSLSTLYVDKNFIHSSIGLTQSQIVQRKTIQEIRANIKEQLTQNLIVEEIPRAPELPVCPPQQKAQSAIIHSPSAEQDQQVLQARSLEPLPQQSKLLP